MAAKPPYNFQTGNKFWELRSKHGRDQLFETPELLQEAAYEYFQWCIDNPLLKYEQARSVKQEKDENGELLHQDQLIGIPTARPFTMQGLRLYIDCSQAYFTNFKHSLKRKIEDEGNKETQETKDQAFDFLNVISRLEEIIYKQKFEGAVVGAYNSNIIARDLGLRDNIDQQVTGNIHLSKEPIVFE